MRARPVLLEKRDLGSLYRVAMDAINGMKQAAAIQQSAFFKCNMCKITYHASQVTFMEKRRIVGSALIMGKLQWGIWDENTVFFEMADGGCHSCGGGHGGNSKVNNEGTQETFDRQRKSVGWRNNEKSSHR